MSEAVGWYLVGAGLGAVGYQHAAYILQFGSIFDRQRAWARTQAPILHELVTCQLCTITQLTLWLWALPWMWFGWEAGVRTAHLIVAFPVVWFSEAALALAFWDLFRLWARGSSALTQWVRAKAKGESYVLRRR